jgi:hypothetical protein
MSDPRVFRTQAVAVPQAQPQGAQPPQVLQGYHAGYAYRVVCGLQPEMPHAHAAHAAHHTHAHPPSPARGGGGRARAAGGAPRSIGPRRRRRKQEQLEQGGVWLDPDEQGAEMGGDPQDEQARPFDPFRHLHLWRAGDGGEGGARQHPLPALARRLLQEALPGARELFGTAGGLVAMRDSMDAAAALLLARVMRGGPPLGLLMLAAARQMLVRSADPPPTNLLDVKNLLLARQRGLGWTPGRALPKDPAVGDRLALLPVYLLNACRPRSEGMRRIAADRLDCLMGVRGSP